MISAFNIGYESHLCTDVEAPLWLKSWHVIFLCRPLSTYLSVERLAIAARSSAELRGVQQLQRGESVQPSLARLLLLMPLQ